MVRAGLAPAEPRRELVRRDRERSWRESDVEDSLELSVEVLDGFELEAAVNVISDLSRELLGGEEA